MARQSALYALVALAAMAAPVAAQEVGGVSLAPAGQAGPSPGTAVVQSILAQQQTVASVAASLRGHAPLTANNAGAEPARSLLHQQMIANIRGDAGFLAGFSRAQPIAPSRIPIEPVPVDQTESFGPPLVINNFDSAINLDFGQENVAQQQLVKQGSGDRRRDANSGATPASTQTPASSGTVPIALGPDATSRFGSLTVNNVDSAVNVATGVGNVAQQQITGVDGAGSRSGGKR